MSSDATRIDRTSERTPVVMSAALASSVGEDGTSEPNVGRVPIRGAVRNDQLDATNGGGIVIFEPSVAQRLLDRGRTIDTSMSTPTRV